MKDKSTQSCLVARERKMYSAQAAIGRLESFDDYATKATYDAVMKWLNVTKYEVFGTVTFRYGGNNRDSLEGIARRLKVQLKKRIDGLKIVFVFEEHRLQGTERAKYHVHLLIEPTGKELPFIKAKLNAACSRIRGDGIRSASLGINDLRLIYDQSDLVDYLTKSIRHGDCSKLEIDFMNSDLPKFQH